MKGAIQHGRKEEKLWFQKYQRKQDWRDSSSHQQGLDFKSKKLRSSVGMNCCQITNLALKEYLDKKERELYESMSKEDLVNMILNRK